MVVTNGNSNNPKKPCGYKVAAKTRLELRGIADQFRALLNASGCYKHGPHFVDAVHLLEDTLFRAGYIVHPIPDSELSETAAFTGLSG